MNFDVISYIRENEENQSCRTFLLSIYFSQAFVLAARWDRMLKDKNNLGPLCTFILMNNYIENYMCVCILYREKL